MRYGRDESIVNALSDVLNRYLDPGDAKQTLHIMKYIFPRQFGLHNVFTSSADPRETIQPFKDCTLREQEISQAGRRASSCKERKSPQAMDGASRIPKRLRGIPMALVKKLQVLHARCSYDQMLRYHCPITVSPRCSREQLYSRSDWSLFRIKVLERTHRTPRKRIALSFPKMLRRYEA